jgi:pimeloyl-ACP methyl ester carboxylesterase
MNYTRLTFLLGIILLVSCSTSRMPSTVINGIGYKSYSKHLSKDLSVSYIDEGKGPATLVFIHGLGSDKKAWAKNIISLKNSYRCIAVDLPGYGSSTKGAAAYDMTYFSETLVSFLEKMKLQNPVLVGHSMGGQVVLYTLIHNPELVDQAVLIAPAGFEEFSQKEANWLKMVYTDKVVAGANEEQIANNLKLNFFNFPSDAAFMIKERVELRSQADFDGYSRMIPKCVAGMLDQPVFMDLSKIKANVLILFGSDDQLIPNQYLHKDLTTSSVAVNGAGAISNSQLEIWQNCGHMLQWECSDATNRAISSFISQN